MITKEEFRQGIQEAIQDMELDSGEFNQLMKDGKDMVPELAQHDKVLADKWQTIWVAIEDFGQYIRSRAEKPNG